MAALDGSLFWIMDDGNQRTVMQRKDGPKVYLYRTGADEQAPPQSKNYCVLSQRPSTHPSGLCA